MIRKIKNTLRPLKVFVQMIDGYLIAKYNSFVNKDFMCNADTQRCFYNKKSPNYKYEYFGKNTPVCCATHLYEILRDVTKVLEENNLEYFISFGTLLGAARHGGMIPWDTDVDILIPDENRKEVFRILNQTFQNSSYVVVEDRDDSIVGNLIRVNYSKNNSLHIDLFTYLNNQDSIAFGYNRSFQKDDIFPLKKIHFYDLKIYGPKNIDLHLGSIYGDNYMDYGYKQWAFNKSKFKITDYSPARIEKQ